MDLKAIVVPCCTLMIHLHSLYLEEQKCLHTTNLYTHTHTHTHTCEVEIFDGRLWSHRDAKFCTEAGSAVVSSINLPFRSRYVVLVSDGSAYIHVLYLHTE